MPLLVRAHVTPGLPWEKAKVELFDRLFIEHFCNGLLALGLNACLYRVLNYSFVYESD